MQQGDLTRSGSDASLQNSQSSAGTERKTVVQRYGFPIPPDKLNPPQQDMSKGIGKLGIHAGKSAAERATELLRPKEATPSRDTTFGNMETRTSQTDSKPPVTTSRPHLINSLANITQHQQLPKISKEQYDAIIQYADEHISETGERARIKAAAYNAFLKPEYPVGGFPVVRSEDLKKNLLYRQAEENRLQMQSDYRERAKENRLQMQSDRKRAEMAEIRTSVIETYGKEGFFSGDQTPAGKENPVDPDPLDFDNPFL